MLRAYAVMCALCLSPAAMAQNKGSVQEQDTCTALTRAYESASKLASLSWAEGIGDNSAPRQTMKNIEINNYLLVKQMNLTLNDSAQVRFAKRASIYYRIRQ